MSAEKFCLKWNDFEKNISGSFRELKDDEDFFDVTLTCDSDKEVSAHKVILSACSPFFRQVLRRHKHHQHPLLYLRGVSFSDLESVLAFMYNGEVNIAQEQLNSFLAVAEDLKVKGLTQGKDGGRTEGETPKSAGLLRSSHSPLPPTKRARHHQPVNYEDTEDEVQEVVPVKTEAGAVALDETKEDLQGFEENYGDFSGYEEQQYGGAGAVIAPTHSTMEISKGESSSISSMRDIQPSHWSSSYIAKLSLVQSFGVLT